MPKQKVLLLQYCFVVLFSNCSVYAAGKSAMVEGPGILNKEARVAYQNLSRPEKEQLRHQVEQVDFCKNPEIGT